MTPSGSPLVLLASASESLAQATLYLLVLLVVCSGVGAAVAIVRVILPGVAAAADRALARTTGRRLLLAGIVPLLGAALLSWALGALGVPPAVGYVFAVLVLLPLALALVLGALAALPHLGARLLEQGTPRSALTRAVGGGVAMGLSATTAFVPALFALVAVLLGGWLVGIGLGAALTREA